MKNIIALTILLLISLGLFTSCVTNNEEKTKELSNQIKEFELCNNKAYAIGTCPRELVGYEFNVELDTCIEVVKTGCTIDTPFESLAQCQKSCYETIRKEKTFFDLFEK